MPSRHLFILSLLFVLFTLVAFFGHPSEGNCDFCRSFRCGHCCRSDRMPCCDRSFSTAAAATLSAQALEEQEYLHFPAISEDQQYQSDEYPLEESDISTLGDGNMDTYSDQTLDVPMDGDYINDASTFDMTKLQQDEESIETYQDFDLNVEEEEGSSPLFLRRAFKSATRAVSRAASRATRAVSRTASRAASTVSRTASRAASTVSRTASRAASTISRAASSAHKAALNTVKTVAKKVESSTTVLLDSVGQKSAIVLSYLGRNVVPSTGGGTITVHHQKKCYTNCEFFNTPDNKKMKNFPNQFQICTACKSPEIVYSPINGRCFSFPSDFATIKQNVIKRIYNLCRTEGKCKCSSTPLNGKKIGLFSEMNLFAVRNTASAISPVSGSYSLVPIYRYFVGGNGRDNHFYTINNAEIGKNLNVGQVGSHGYRYEGIQGYCSKKQIPGTVPLYRYYNGRINNHFYTTNVNEIGANVKVGQIGKHGYKFEGIMCYIWNRSRNGVTPLYRYFRSDVGNHFYTTNINEIGPVAVGKVGKHGYKYEGIQGYVATKASISK